MLSKVGVRAVVIGRCAKAKSLNGQSLKTISPTSEHHSRFFAISAVQRSKDKEEESGQNQADVQPPGRKGKDETSRQAIEEAMCNVQGLQGEPVHYFTPTYSRDVMYQMHDNARDRFHDINQGMQTDPSRGDSCSYSHHARAQNPVTPDSYEHSSHVSLYSVMQSNVPHPYNQGPTHFNMPSGGHSQQQKYISGMLTDAHPSRQFGTTSEMESAAEKPVGKPEENPAEKPEVSSRGSGKVGEGEEGSGGGGEGDKTKDLSQRARLKRAVKDYGATVIVFHVAISLASLGGFYVAVTSGIDVLGFLKTLGVGESILESRLAAGASTFVIAYAVHKVFAPVRIAITLTCTPFIVRHLRRIGFLKPPKV